MKARILNALVLIAVGLLVAGCASTPKSEKYSELPEAGKLQPDARFAHSLVYIKEGVAFGQYSKFIIDAVAIYGGKDAGWRGVSDETKQQTARFAHDEFVRVLGQKYEVVDKPGPGVLRLKLTLADMELTHPVLAVPSHLAPAGIATNLGLSAGGMKGSFMGSATVAGELHDAQSGQLVASFLTKQTPLAIDITATFTKTEAARKAITETAEKFRAAMDRAHAAPSSSGNR